MMRWRDRCYEDIRVMSVAQALRVYGWLLFVGLESTLIERTIFVGTLDGCYS